MNILLFVIGILCLGVAYINNHLHQKALKKYTDFNAVPNWYFWRGLTTMLLCVAGIVLVLYSIPYK
jgi:hypothetical protein